MWYYTILYKNKNTLLDFTHNSFIYKMFKSSFKKIAILNLYEKYNFDITNTYKPVFARFCILIKDSLITLIS